jgi:hypothetical protein
MARNAKSIGKVKKYITVSARKHDKIILKLMLHKYGVQGWSGMN